jgi:hypothetical protein
MDCSLIESAKSDGESTMRFPLHTVACAIALTAASGESSADVIEFTDKAEWEAAAGQFTTIDFTGFDSMTIITDQYIDLGVLFTGGDDLILPNSSFVNDGWGLAGHDSIDMVFLEALFVLAVDFPGSLIIDLYSDGELMYSNGFAEPGEGHFAGLISTDPFDFVVLRREFDPVFIDDLHFGPPIPAPPAFAPLLFAAFTARRRRA